MIRRLALTLGLISISSCALAGVQSYYCPENHGYIQLGYTSAQVLAACGKPLSQQDSDEPVMQRVQVKQLIYNNMGTQKVFYGTWAIPTGVTGGTTLQVNLVDNKVKGITVNGSESNAFSVCQGANIQIGDPASVVYGSCGNPAAVNDTFINQPVQSNSKPQLWIYQPTPFQSPITLTFVNGKLQSID